MNVQQLWDSWLETGDDKLWVGIYEYLYPRFHSYLYSTVKDNDNRSEIINSTFIKIISRKSLYNPEFKFTTWAYAILNNERMLIWKRYKRQHTSYDELIENKWAYEPADVNDYDPTIEALYARTVEAIYALEEPYREVMILRELKNYSYEELREHLGWKMNTVKTRIRRGREIVREMVNREAFLDSFD